MDKDKKLAIARKKLKKFQARNSQQNINCSTSPRIHSDVNHPFTSATLAQSNLSFDLNPARPPAITGLSGLEQETSSAAKVNIVRPLSSVPEGQNASSYLFPSTMGGENTPLLNGSIDHLSPLDLSTVANLEPPSINFSETLQPYMNNYSTASAASPSVLSGRKGGAIDGRGGDERMGGGEGGEGRRRIGVEGLEGVGGGQGEDRGAPGVFSGASHGGVLLNHMPYLPSSSNPIRIPPEGLVEEALGHCEAGGGRNMAPRVTRGSKVGRSVVDEVIKELEQKVKAHAQTIDILVSEKSSLQSELSNFKSQLSSKSRECLDSEVHVRSMERKLAKLEGDVTNSSAELTKKSREMDVAKEARVKLQKSLERVRASLEDQREEGTELISKVTTQAAELVRLQGDNADLQSRLNMAELLSQQLSGGKEIKVTPSDRALSQHLHEAEERVQDLRHELDHVTQQRDQANFDLTTLQDCLSEQREDSARKLAECRSQITLVKKELDDVSVKRQVLEKRLSTEHAQTEHSFQVAMETLKQERDILTNQLGEQVQENINLVKKNTVVENSLLEMTMKLSRLEEQSVDNEHLLRTMTQDKETLSRAMSQNKGLKVNNAELQDAYVKLSNQTMQLASDLDTERRRVTHLRMTQTATHTSECATPTSLSRDMLTSSHAPPTSIKKVPGESVMEDAAETEKVSLDFVDAGAVAPSLVVEIEQHQQIETLEQEKTRLLDQLKQLQVDNQQLQHVLKTSQEHMMETTSKERCSSLVQTAGVSDESRLSDESHKGAENDPQYFPSTGDVKTQCLSPRQLDELQTSFDALQMKFVMLMREKADLLEMLDVNKLLLANFSMEEEIVAGRDVSAYQKECEILRRQFQQKDTFIHKLMAEKTIMQSSVAQLQVLMRRITEQRPKVPPISPYHPPPTTRTSQPRMITLPLSSSSPQIGHTPSPLSQSTVPLHLRPLLSNSDCLPSDDEFLPHSSQDDLQVLAGQDGENFDDTNRNCSIWNIENGSNMTDASTIGSTTAEQIMELLDQLERSGRGDVNECEGEGSPVMVHCKTCKGELLAV